MMTRDGRWQPMSSEEQAGFMRQATRGHLTPELIGKMANQGNVKDSGADASDLQARQRLRGRGQ